MENNDQSITRSLNSPKPLVSVTVTSRVAPLAPAEVRSRMAPRRAVTAERRVCFIMTGRTSNSGAVENVSGRKRRERLGKTDDGVRSASALAVENQLRCLTFRRS
jgi:hypothetical protein